MVGDIRQGGEVQYISAENGYGVTSLVEQLTPNEFIQLRHSADTQNSGTQTRDKEWTGGKESYKITEKVGITKLTVVFDVPPEQTDYFANNYPKALERVKALAEKQN